MFAYGKEPNQYTLVSYGPKRGKCFDVSTFHDDDAPSLFVKNTQKNYNFMSILGMFRFLRNPKKIDDQLGFKRPKTKYDMVIKVMFN